MLSLDCPQSLYYSFPREKVWCGGYHGDLQILENCNGYQHMSRVKKIQFSLICQPPMNPPLLEPWIEYLSPTHMDREWILLTSQPAAGQYNRRQNSKIPGKVVGSATLSDGSASWWRRLIRSLPASSSLTLKLKCNHAVLNKSDESWNIGLKLSTCSLGSLGPPDLQYVIFLWTMGLIGQSS